MAFRADESLVEELTVSLDCWEQGDILPVNQMAFLADPARPLTPESAQVPGLLNNQIGAPTVVVASAPLGMILVSQTCDIIKQADRSPFVLAAPLRTLNADQTKAAALGRMPRYIPIPGVEGEIFADLAATCCLEKTLLVGTPAVKGCRSDEERRQFSRALARFFDRFAFPDEFHPATQALKTRFSQLGGEDAEGKARNLVLEVRAVTAEGDWGAAQLHVHLYFLVDLEEDYLNLPEEIWQRAADDWVSDCVPTERIAAFTGEVLPLDRLPAGDYLRSDGVDLSTDS